MKTFEVLGTGCRKCAATAESIEQVAKEQGKDVNVVKVTDAAKIMNYQVMSTPAVAVDGKLVHGGSVPDHAIIAEWLNS